jgi:hypothetical protein
MAAELDTPLNCRIPRWMANGLKDVAKKHRVRGVSDPVRWALEDLLAREGITEPGADPAAA